MTAHDGKLIVAGVNRDTGIVLSYDPASDAWSENDAVNFPLHAALVDYQGDLLVVGQLSRYMDVDAGDGQGGDGGQNSDYGIEPTRIARWELRPNGIDEP